MKAKSKIELEELQCVILAAEAAMKAVIDYLQKTESPTADEAHILIDRVLSDYDCESPNGHIVASGITSYEPHAIGEGIILKGVPIVIDIYPQSKKSSWWADISRTVCIGKPTPELSEMYQTVKDVQELVAQHTRPGVRCKDMYSLALESFTKRGYYTGGVGTEFTYAFGFVHSLGNGIGNQVHESPKLRSDSVDILQVGDVITIEPGLYYETIGGVRLEDMYRITDSGCVQLTNFPHFLHL